MKNCKLNILEILSLWPNVMPIPPIVLWNSCQQSSATPNLTKGKSTVKRFVTFTMVVLFTCCMFRPFSYAQKASYDSVNNHNSSKFSTLKNISDLPSEEQLRTKVKEMISQMTLEEKVAQLSGIRWRDWFQGININPVNFNKIAHGIGHICQFACMSDLTMDQHRAAIDEAQKFLKEKTHLGIPAIFHEEATCGLAARGATSFPQQIGMGCTWNPELVKKNTATIRMLMLKIGARQALAPNLDINRNAHWGRIEETYGEDPYLISRMGLEYVRTLQTNDLRHGVAVTLKHFAGYGDGGAATQDPWTFREESLRPYEVAIRFGNAQSAMAGYHLFHNQPCSSSKELLIDILRHQLDFNGVVVSDYAAINQIVNEYHRANGLKEAAIQSVLSGTDVDLPDGEAFHTISASVKEGRIPQEVLDLAVERLLMLKARLGLLDNTADTSNSGDPIVGDTPESRQLAYESACQSLVLLKNNSILPIKKAVHSIAVIGPNAASLESLNGDYSHQTLAANCAGIAIHPDGPKLITLLCGMQTKADPSMKIVYERGCSWTEPINLNDDSIKIAAECDLIIAAVGENKDLCGEGHDRSDARLPGHQEELVRRLAATGKPIVLVYMGGRPPILTDLEPLCQAIVCAWYPGEEGGNAMADLLFGNINPSGKLSTTLPRSNAQCPIAYEWGYKPDDMPLYPFGYGLSYTTYAYGSLKIPTKVRTTDSTFPVTFTVDNRGQRDGIEISQLYVVPQNIKAPHPVQVLRGFARIALKAGEKKTVTIHISPQTLAFYDKDMHLAIEPGRYEFRIGASSTDIKAKAIVTLKGSSVTLSRREVFFNETDVK